MLPSWRPSDMSPVIPIASLAGDPEVARVVATCFLPPNWAGELHLRSPALFWVSERQLPRILPTNVALLTCQEITL